MDLACFFRLEPDNMHLIYATYDNRRCANSDVDPHYFLKEYAHIASTSAYAMSKLESNKLMWVMQPLFHW